MLAVSNSVEQTERLGYMFAGRLSGNETICLIGDVGSGKSSFIRGMVKYLFPNEQYKMPIDWNVCNYHNKMLHIDGSNFLKRGLPEEFLEFNGIRVIEHGNLWSELPYDFTIKISKESNKVVKIWQKPDLYQIQV